MPPGKGIMFLTCSFLRLCVRLFVFRKRISRFWLTGPELHAGPNFAIRPDQKNVTRPDPLICAVLGWIQPDPTRPAGQSIKRKNHKTPHHQHRVAFQILMKSFSIHLTSEMNFVSVFQDEFFAFLAQSSFYIDSRPIWFRHFAETRLRALQLSILHRRYWIYSWNIVQTEMQNKVQIEGTLK